jgi:hypothetical protein
VRGTATTEPSAPEDAEPNRFDTAIPCVAQIAALAEKRDSSSNLAIARITNQLVAELVNIYP